MKIIKCNCKHTFQDETLGQGMRWHNLRTVGKASNRDVRGYKCTVCGNEKDKTADKK